jgi:hypothetical protein
VQFEVRRISQAMSVCLDLVSFADGELDVARAAVFRDHLRTCDACRTGLVEAMQLSAQLSTLTPSLEHEYTVAPSLADGAVASLATRHRAGVVRSATQAVPARSPGRPSRWILKTGAALALAVAAVLLLRHFPSGPSGPPDPTPRANGFAELKTRPYEIRVAYRDAAAHRPLRDVTLGAASAAAPADHIPYAALGVLEAHGDKHGLAIARAWNGEHKLSDVVKQLSELGPTPSVRSDRAAVSILATSNDNVAPVLAELESLMNSDDAVAARAARWNYAILLCRLELPLTAAQAFRAIASDGEPGWSDEAGARAATQEQLGQDFRSKWQRASGSGQALVDGAAAVPGDLVQQFPGLLRAYFYHAVRAAPGRERVLALAPMAAELDQLGDPQQHTLRDYVQRVAKLDFRRRAPLASAYADLLNHKPVAAQLETALVTETASADTADIVMGAMVERDVIADHRGWFRAMVAQTGDRWFAVVLARAEADAELQAGNSLGAEAILRSAESLCSPALIYQCLTIKRRLGRLYTDLHRVHESLKVLQEAVHAARSAGEWGRYPGLLGQLADTERLHSATATVRAYGNELLLMADDCRGRRPTYHTLAGAALLDVDGRTARRYAAQALACEEPDLRTANELAEIARMDPQPGDVSQLQNILSKVRASGKLTAAEQLLTYEIEGRLLIDRDRTAGTVLLNKAIAEADTRPRDVVADKARAGAYGVLVVDAARARDYTRALSLVTEELGLSPAGACAVGMAAEDARAVVVVRGADGEDRGEYFDDRRRSEGALTVSAQLANHLAGCPRVRVMAPAALQGQPRVLPAQLAWSYVASARGRVTPSNPATEPHTLIVTNVMPPAYLQLSPLTIQPPADGPATTLSGLDATPARVMAAMAGASEIQFHTHALMDVGVSDASHLVLSPGNDGRYALTAEAIRGLQLRGHPIVVLAACHSAQGARYQHEPWSLPDALLAAGARAVFAAATEIPDVESEQVFSSVLAQVRTGVDPAVALRDRRLAPRARASSWVDDVVVFDEDLSIKGPRTLSEDVEVDVG